jgi:excisionase family DNA binding protein
MSTSEALSPMARLDSLESSLLAFLQEIRSIKAQLQKGINTDTLEPLLEAEDVAKLLGVDVGYVYAQAAAGKIPSIKLGKYRKFSPSQLKKWPDQE